jgi:pimeloyl-ACP methyl ester carboxylesterase
MEFAANHPSAVPAMVLADTASRIGSAASWQQRIVAVQRLGMEQLAPTVLEIWFSASFHSNEPAQSSGFRNMLARMPAEGYAASCAALMESDLTERVASIQVPALVLTGQEDRATPPEQGRSLASALPSARFELLAGAAHLPCIEQPERMATVIRRFLQEQHYG